MAEAITRRTRFHYAWVVAATGTLCIFASLGFGRFALGMLLPSMAASLKLSYAQIGFISTANFVGYLLAVLLCGRAARRMGPRALIASALALSGLSMALIARATGFGTVLLLYLITGVGSGASNVPMMGLVTAWFDRTIRGRAAGFVAIGSGFAIIVSGQLIPMVNRRVGPEGWRTSWELLAITVVAIALVCGLLLRNRPEEKGLSPLGHERPGVAEAPPPPAAGSLHRNRSVQLLSAIYFLFGYTYVIYATFVVTALVNERGFSEALAGRFWSWVGLLSLVSGPLFGALSDRLGRRAGLAIVFAIQLCAYLLVAADLPPLFLYLSIACYGIVAWSIPSIMVAAVSEYVGPEQALPAFGLVTFVFALGQIAGPSVAGLLKDHTGSFSSSFLMAAAFAAAAILLTGLLRKPHRTG